jgi:hypothetical protein
MEFVQSHGQAGFLIEPLEATGCTFEFDSDVAGSKGWVGLRLFEIKAEFSAGVGAIFLFKFFTRAFRESHLKVCECIRSIKEIP